MPHSGRILCRDVIPSPVRGGGPRRAYRTRGLRMRHGIIFCSRTGLWFTLPQMKVPFQPGFQWTALQMVRLLAGADPSDSQTEQVKTEKSNISLNTTYLLLLMSNDIISFN